MDFSSALLAIFTLTVLSLSPFNICLWYLPLVFVLIFYIHLVFVFSAACAGVGAVIILLKHKNTLRAFIFFPPCIFTKWEMFPHHLYCLFLFCKKRLQLTLPKQSLVETGGFQLLICGPWGERSGLHSEFFLCCKYWIIFLFVCLQ